MPRQNAAHPLDDRLRQRSTTAKLYGYLGRSLESATAAPDAAMKNGQTNEAPITNDAAASTLQTRKCNDARYYGHPHSHDDVQRYGMASPRPLQSMMLRQGT